MKVAIVDYGMGNLHSVLKSVQAAQKLADVNAQIVLTDRPEEVFAADKVVFPGQGAMPDCMAALQRSGLGEAVSDGLKNKPFFGICVGAQLLFDHSEEGDTAGLGWFAGDVKRFFGQPPRCRGRQTQSAAYGLEHRASNAGAPAVSRCAPKHPFLFRAQLLFRARR